MLRLHMLLKARLVRDKMAAFYETIERPLAPIVAAMERHGIKVDRAALARLVVPQADPFLLRPGGTGDANRPRPA